LAKAVERGKELGLEVAAGHGITRRKNVVQLVKTEIVESNIGHAVISDALFLRSARR
jgi:pyridoxine 5-phosphate synthase